MTIIIDEKSSKSNGDLTETAISSVAEQFSAMDDVDIELVLGRRTQVEQPPLSLTPTDSHSPNVDNDTDTAPSPHNMVVVARFRIDYHGSPPDGLSINPAYGYIRNNRGGGRDSTAAATAAAATAATKNAATTATTTHDVYEQLEAFHEQIEKEVIRPRYAAYWRNQIRAFYVFGILLLLVLLVPVLVVCDILFALPLVTIAAGIGVCCRNHRQNKAEIFETVDKLLQEENEKKDNGGGDRLFFRRRDDGVAVVSDRYSDDSPTRTAHEHRPCVEALMDQAVADAKYRVASASYRTIPNVCGHLGLVLEEKFAVVPSSSSPVVRDCRGDDGYVVQSFDGPSRHQAVIQPGDVLCELDHIVVRNASAAEICRLFNMRRRSARTLIMKRYNIK